MNTHNPASKTIRFIDSCYKDLFRIPNGSCIQIHYPGETVVKPCTYIDDYHTKIGHNIFHICEFAESMERNNASYMAEPAIMGDKAAWLVGTDRILALQFCDEGYDYTLCDLNYVELDGGKWEGSELSMIEVRTEILRSFGLGNRELRAMFFEDVMEEVFEAGRQAAVIDDRTAIPSTNNILSASVPSRTVYTAELLIPQAKLDYIQKLLALSGSEIYDQYGLKRDETITHTLRFSDGCALDIKVVICEEDTPYIDLVLFDKDGRELACDTADDTTIEGPVTFETATGIYTGTIKAQQRILEDHPVALEAMIQQASLQKEKLSKDPELSAKGSDLTL